MILVIKFTNGYHDYNSMVECQTCALGLSKRQHQHVTAMTYTFSPAIGLSFSPQKKAPQQSIPHDYADILRKHDDRLITDIGMTREDIVGPEEHFWSEWTKIKEPWQL
jgi:hypothetical protein